MNIREKQKEKRREEILTIGLELFVKNGYTSTKTSDIAKALNISDGLLFHYFSTKEKLYEELIRIAMEKSQDWIENNENSPLLFFTKITEEILSMLQENPQRAKFFVLMAQALRSNATPQGVVQILSAQNNRYKKTVEIILQGQASGEIRDGNPNALAYTFWCSIQGVAEQLAVSPETPFPEAEWIISIIKNPKGDI